MSQDMSEHVSRTASNLLPLLLLLGGIFLLLILAAVFLRYRIRLKTGPTRKRKGSPAQMQPGDVVSVLGTTFQVKTNTTVQLEGGPMAWCSLEGEDKRGSVLLSPDMKSAVYFPGTADAGETASFPEEIKREEGAYALCESPAGVTSGHRLALYQGPGERWLAVEVRNAECTLWRGKSIPPEGVRMIED
jgi:hypothetical protein